MEYYEDTGGEEISYEYEAPAEEYASDPLTPVEEPVEEPPWEPPAPPVVDEPPQQQAPPAPPTDERPPVEASPPSVDPAPGEPLMEEEPIVDAEEQGDAEDYAFEEEIDAESDEFDTEEDVDDELSLEYEQTAEPVAETADDGVSTDNGVPTADESYGANPVAGVVEEAAATTESPVAEYLAEDDAVSQQSGLQPTEAEDTVILDLGIDPEMAFVFDGDPSEWAQPGSPHEWEPWVPPTPPASESMTSIGSTEWGYVEADWARHGEEPFQAVEREAVIDPAERGEVRWTYSGTPCCGIDSLHSVISETYGQPTDVDEMATRAAANGWLAFDEGKAVGIQPQFVDDMLASYGVGSHQFGGPDAPRVGEQEAWETLNTALTNRQLVTLDGVAVRGVDYERGMLMVSESAAGNGVGVPLDVFYQAWRDSNFSMTITDPTVEGGGASPPEGTDGFVMDAPGCCVLGASLEATPQPESKLPEAETDSEQAEAAGHDAAEAEPVTATADDATDAVYHLEDHSLPVQAAVNLGVGGLAGTYDCCRGAAAVASVPGDPYGDYAGAAPDTDTGEPLMCGGLSDGLYATPAADEALLGPAPGAVPGESGVSYVGAMQGAPLDLGSSAPPGDWVTVGGSGQETGLAPPGDWVTVGGSGQDTGLAPPGNWVTVGGSGQDTGLAPPGNWVTVGGYGQDTGLAPPGNWVTVGGYSESWPGLQPPQGLADSSEALRQDGQRLLSTFANDFRIGRGGGVAFPSQAFSLSQFNDIWSATNLNAALLGPSNYYARAQGGRGVRWEDYGGTDQL